MGSESIEAATITNSSSSSGEKVFPPGFRFHPTDEELILYYLKRKICGRSLKLDIVGEVDVYKWHPEELPGQSKWKTDDRQWFFFSPRDRRYPNGARSNRATMHGYWKATGKDRIIKCNARVVGLKKTLIYYHGRAPTGQRTDWVMHEYTLDENELNRCRYMQEYYALYKVFKKSGPGPKNGEQYGAPFVEEEWADDDDYLDVDALLMQHVTSSVHEPELSVEPEKEDQENLLVCSLTQAEDVDQRLAMGSSQNLLLVQPDSDLAQSANEPSVITCVEEVQPSVVNEDFLELDDLISPQPAFQNSELPLLDDLQFADFDGFCAYRDSTTSNEFDPFRSQHIQQPSYTSSLVEYEATNAEFQTGHDFWTQATEANIPSPSGVITNEMSENQHKGFGEDYGSDSWFASALWAFVESVPSRPASALESSGPVNKGFSKIKNVDRTVHINFKSTTRRVDWSLKSSRGIVYFSVLGVLFAIICAFVGTSVKLLGRCIS